MPDIRITAPAPPAQAGTAPASPPSFSQMFEGDDDAVKNKFLENRAKVSSGDDGWIKQAAGSQQPPPTADVPGVGVVPMYSDPSIEFGKKLKDATGAVVKDVAYGVADSPRQVLGGTVDFANNLFKFADDVVKKTDAAGLPNAYFRLLDKDGNWSPSVMSPEEFNQERAAGRDDVFQLPTTGKPDTVTGNIIRTGMTFLLGRGRLPAGAGVIPNLVADFTSGALMPSDQPRLSNIIDSVAPNFLTDWLKAKGPGQEDPLLARLKSGLEYSGLGLMFEGIKQTLQTVKGAHADLGDRSPFAGLTSELPPPNEGAAPKTVPSVAAGGQAPWYGLTTDGPDALKAKLPAAVEAPTGRDFLLLGDPVTAPVRLPNSPQIQSQADAFLRGEIGDNPVKINMAYIQSPEQIEDMLSRVSTFIPKTGPVSWQETETLANTLGVTPQKLIEGYGRGSGLDSVNMRAADLMVRSGADQLGKYVTMALNPETATPEAKALAIKAFLAQRAMQEYFENAKSEAGRTLNILKMMSVPRSDYAAAVDQIVQQGDAIGMEGVFQKIASLGEPGAPGTAEKVSAMVGKTFDMTSRDAMLYGWYNVLLSNPRTIVKKLTSDVSNGMWNLATNYYAERFGSGAVPPGETAQLLYGYAGSFKEGLRAAGKALKAGESQFWRDYEGNAASSMHSSLLGEDLGNTIPNDAATPSVAAYLKSAMPTSWIASVDDMATVINYRAYLRSLAYRSGAERGLNGEDLALRVDELMNNPPRWLHQAAVDNALRSTFKEPLTGAAQTLSDLAQQINIPIAHTQMEIPLGKILLPFVKIPANIVKWSYRNSIAGAMMPSSALRQELAQGGATRDLAIARMTMGTSLALAFSDLALNYNMTGRGPKDPQLQRAWRAAGNEPYSFRIGDKWYGYNQVEPFGMMAGAVADTFDIMRFAKDDGRENLASSIAFGLGNALLSKTYMSGVANFFEAMNDPERSGDMWWRNIASGIAVPQGVAALARTTDDFVRQHYSLMEDIERRLPMVSQGLPPARTLWGDPIPQKDGYLPFMPGKAGRLFSPVPVAPINVEPIDKWIWDNRMDFPRAPSNQLGLSKPGIVQNFSGGRGVSTQIELTPQMYDRFQTLAGNELKDPSTGMGAKDLLNSLVKGEGPRSAQDQWNKSTDGERALIVQQVVTKYRMEAKKELLRDFPELADAVQTGLQSRVQDLQRQQSSTPMLQPPQAGGAAGGAAPPAIH